MGEDPLSSITACIHRLMGEDSLSSITACIHRLMGEDPLLPGQLVTFTECCFLGKEAPQFLEGALPLKVRQLGLVFLGSS